MKIRTPRRLASLIAGVAVAASALAGCSPATTGGDTEPEQSSESSLLPAAEGKTEYPLTLETAWGETTLKERPQRVAVLDVNTVAPDVVLSLGVTPVAANRNVNIHPYLADAGGADVEYLLEGADNGEVSLEQIAAAEPDLIIAPTQDLTDTWDALTQIAPVLGSPEKQDDYVNGNPWEELVPRIGEALDLQDKAAQVVEEYDAFIAEQKAKYPEFAGKTLNYVVYFGADSGQRNYVYSGSTNEQLLAEIGFAPNAHPEAGPMIPDENLSMLDADVLVITPRADQDMAFLDELTSKPLFQQLQAVKDNHVVKIDPRQNEGLSWAFAVNAPIAQQYALETLLPQVSDVLK